MTLYVNIVFPGLCSIQQFRQSISINDTEIISLQENSPDPAELLNDSPSSSVNLHLPRAVFRPTTFKEWPRPKRKTHFSTGQVDIKRAFTHEGINHSRRPKAGLKYHYYYLWYFFLR